MKTFIRIIVSLLIGLLGFFMEVAVKKTVDYKEDKGLRQYKVEKEYRKNDGIINFIILTLGSLSSLIYFGKLKSIFNIIMLLLAVFIVRLDERIRIIPNEAVLFVLTVGLILHLYFRGIKGIFYGLTGLIATALLFFIAAILTKLFCGTIGVGAGDVKMAMAISFLLGRGSVFNYWLGISLFLLIYILVGLYTKTLKIGSYFPMALQVMGGFIFVLYEPFIIAFLRWVF